MPANTRRSPASAFGELDPNDRRNAVIQDIQLAPRNARGMVEYTATFQIVKPVDMSKASHLMWHDVPNRAGRLTIVPIERAQWRHRPLQRLAGRRFGRHRSGGEQ